MQMKYISFDNGLYTEMVIFGGHRNHADVARSFDIKRIEIVGAGFVDIDKAWVGGYSQSLKIGPHSDDQKLLNSMGEK